MSRRIVLFMDVNKTIVLFDNGNDTSAAHNVVAQLGKSICHTWDSRVLESYSSYVRRSLAPGDEVADPALKKRRQVLDNDLLSRFACVPGGMAMQSRYEAMLLKLDAMHAQKRIILPSFQRLLSELKSQRYRVAASIVLRSFGPDVSDAFREVTETNPHFSQGHFGMFCKGELRRLASIDDVTAAYSASRVGTERRPLAEVLAPFPAVDIFTATAELPEGSISVWSDDYSHWHDSGEIAIAGKPFPVTQEPLTLFFDDNAEEKEILAPIFSSEYSGESCSTTGRIVAVDPVLALECDDYFVGILRSLGVLE